MKRATAVIGAAFGDEGKGLFTDYFCRLAGSEPLVVRFNGGAQAGHTVVTPTGIRHVFHHFGSGTLAGARTYLSRFFLVNPVLWLKEHQELQALSEQHNLGLRLRLFVDREAPLTTVIDMIEGQDRERQKRHGSCGAGIHATMVRQKYAQYRLFAGDLDNPMFLSDRVYKIRKQVDSTISDEVIERFLEDCRLMRSHINFCDSRLMAAHPGDIVFEGAQGLLLDQDNNEFFPHVTHSHTGLRNVATLARECNIHPINVVYVLRSYITRHGAGLLPSEASELSYPDDTNVENEWQGKLRFAPLDARNREMVGNAILRDFSGNERAGMKLSVAMTHLDQCEIPNFEKLRTTFRSHGPSAGNIEGKAEWPH